MNRNFRSYFIQLILASCLSIVATSVSADTLLIDAISMAPPNDPSGLPRPVNGQSMEMVLARFGEPKKKLSQVGDPPITRWVYEKFTVYFEHNSVVNSAVHLGPKSKKEK